MIENTQDPAKIPVLRKLWARAARSAFLEKPVPVAELNRGMLHSARPVFSFYLLLALATIIATSGLLANSAGVIIGAMIVAPLMNPIVAFSYSAGRANWRLSILAVTTMISGVLLTILMAYVGTKILGLRIAGSEILGRTQPTLLDLAVAIAAGTAAAFAISRKSIANALPGTAISVALVPPLCVVGIGLATGEAIVSDVGLDYIPLGPGSTGIDIATDSFILFLTNLAGIVLAAELVFILQGYGTLRKGAVGFAITLTAAILLMLPLGTSLHTLYSRSVAMTVARSMFSEVKAKGETPANILALRVYPTGDTLSLDIKVLQSESRNETSHERAREFQQRLSKRLGQPVRLKIEMVIVPIETFIVEGDPD